MWNEHRQYIMQCTSIGGEGGGWVSATRHIIQIIKWKKYHVSYKKVMLLFLDRTEPHCSCINSACWLVRHDTTGCLCYCISVWYFCLQVLWCWRCNVGRRGNSIGVFFLDSICYAVKGKICHTLWAQFAVQPKVKFHQLQRLCYAVSGKCPYTELCFLCSQRRSVKLSSWPGFLRQVQTPAKVKNTDGFAVQAKRWLVLRSVCLSIKLIPYFQCWDTVDAPSIKLQHLMTSLSPSSLFCLLSLWIS